MSDLEFGLSVTAAGLAIVFGLLAGLWLLLTFAIRIERRAGGRPADAPPGGPDAASAEPGASMHSTLIMK